MGIGPGFGFISISPLAPHLSGDHGTTEAFHFTKEIRILAKDRLPDDSHSRHIVSIGSWACGLRLIKKLKCTACCHLSPSTILQFFD